MAVMMRTDVDPHDDGKFAKALAEERQDLGVTSDANMTNAMPNDAALLAIEGRGAKNQRDEAINFGMGGARVFSPSEVKALAEQLGRIPAAEMRLHFNRTEMARWDVGGLDWLGEPDSVLESILIPEFQKLQAFYRRAAETGHYILVVYQ
jgi:hypothetical protein